MQVHIADRIVSPPGNHEETRVQLLIAIHVRRRACPVVPWLRQTVYTSNPQQAAHLCSGAAAALPACSARSLRAISASTNCTSAEGDGYQQEQNVEHGPRL